MGNVLQYPEKTKTSPISKGAIGASFDFHHQKTRDGQDFTMVTGRVRLSATDPIKIKVYIDDPSVVVKKGWVDLTDRGEMSFFFCTNPKLVRYGHVDYFPELHCVYCSFGITNPQLSIAEDNLILEWKGHAAVPWAIFAGA